MFRELTKIYEIGTEFLVDNRGFKFKRKFPIKTADIVFYGYPYWREVPANLAELSRLQKCLAKLSPPPNAWLDKGIITNEIKEIDFPNLDSEGNIYREKIPVQCGTHRIEFYHLGE